MDITTLESLVATNNELLLHIYTSQLFCVSVVGVGLVLFLLYKFLRKFF